MSTWPVVDGKLYYIGGEEKSNALNTIHVFNPRDGDDGTWTSFSPSYPTGLHGVGPVVVDNAIYVMGGGTSVNVSGRTDSCYVLTIGTTPVSRKPDTGIRRYHTTRPRVVLFPNIADHTWLVYSLTGKRIEGKKGKVGEIAPRVAGTER